MRLDRMKATYRIPHRRTPCQDQQVFGLEQSVHNLRRHDHEPVGGEWLSPPQVIGMTALTLFLGFTDMGLVAMKTAVAAKFGVGAAAG